MSQLAREYIYSRAASDLHSAQHWVGTTNQALDGQNPSATPAQSRAAAMHSTNYRTVPGVPANLTNTFSAYVGYGPGLALPGGEGLAQSHLQPSASGFEDSRRLEAGPPSGVEDHEGPVYIRNQRKDPAIVAANAGSNFLGYHTLASTRTPEAVFMPPPGPFYVIPEYTAAAKASLTRLTAAAGGLRRIPKTIEPGEALVMLFDDGPRVVQAVERVPFLVYSVRARWTIIGTWNERKYAIVDPSSEVAVQGRRWYRFLQPTEIGPNDVRPLMQKCLDAKGWEFVDARPPGYHIKRRQKEVPFLEMLMNTEIDWTITEWMVGGVSQYGE
ncbi:hypothetical protein FRB90_004402 [Tulasnella sp. 427]|nr:hypothetical protein FRB90_004402 [Tulasnella sp. 427]